MIKDKITPEIKNRFMEDIRKTINDGKEYGFFLCKDTNGELFPTTSLKGEDTQINLYELRSQCPFDAQGEFHTHANIPQIKDSIEKHLNMKLNPDSIPELYKQARKAFNISTEISHGDLLSGLMLKHDNQTSGTICVGSDTEPSKIECWTPNKIVTKDIYDKATKEFKSEAVRDTPREWIKPFFDKEIILLK